jgi:hypothetical protein
VVERDLGQATIAYDDPDEGTVTRTVQNEHLAYFQDHWILKADEGEEDHDVVRRIPHHRVHYVERSVDEFESEVRTLQHRVQSLADDLRSKLLGGDGTERRGREERDVHRIDIESGEPADDER